MKIELVIDENCVSLKRVLEIMGQLSCEFSESERHISSFNDDRERFTALGVHLLPAWLVDERLLRVDPVDYGALKKHILSKDWRLNAIDE